VNVDAVMIGELQDDVRSVLEVLWRDWFGINPTAGAGLLERAHSVVLLAMIVAAAVGVGGVLARAVLVRRAGDRPCARRLLRIAVAAAVVLAAVIWAVQAGAHTARLLLVPLGGADPAALAHLAAAPGDTGGWALVGMVTVGWVTPQPTGFRRATPHPRATLR